MHQQVQKENFVPYSPPETSLKANDDHKKNANPQFVWHENSKHLIKGLSLKGGSLHHLENLCAVLIKFLHGKPLSIDDFKLSDLETRIFICFQTKKYNLTPKALADWGLKDVKKISAAALFETTCSLRRLPSQRRKEENLKLVFNWAYKRLKENLCRRTRTSKDQSEQVFCQYYFGVVAKKEGLPIEAFKQPSFSRIISDGPKTYNNKFLQNIKLSPIFIADFHHIIETEFLKDYDLFISQKVLAHCRKLEEEIKLRGCTPNEITVICQSLARNARIKLPWSSAEARHAKETVLQRLSNS